MDPPGSLAAVSLRRLPKLIERLVSRLVSSLGEDREGGISPDLALISLVEHGERRKGRVGTATDDAARIAQPLQLAQRLG